MSWLFGYGLARAVGSLMRGESESGVRANEDYILPDERARQAACALLDADTELSASKLEVCVLSGEITLTGSVASEALKARAEQLCSAIGGIRKLESKLVVAR